MLLKDTTDGPIAMAFARLSFLLKRIRSANIVRKISENHKKGRCAMTPIFEHVNLTVTDAERTAKRLCALFDWKVRWHGPAINDGYTYHIGTDDFYLALYAPRETQGAQPDGFRMVGRLNHVGVVVDDLKEVEQRVINAGLKPQNHSDYAPGRRFYFYDEDRIEFEVVSYN